MASRQTIIRWLMVGGGVLLCLWFFYPGYISYDAIDQLTQAREGVFRDWHPPLMAYLWGFLDRIVPGPALMLLWQNLMFWGGLGLLAGRLGGWRGILFMVGVGLVPPLFVNLGSIWKDTALASALLLATGILSHAHAHRKAGIASLALLPLFYALALRHNAAPALLPFMAWWAWQVTHFSALRLRWLNMWTVGGATLLLLLAGVTGVNTLLTSYPTYPTQQILAHDVVAVSLAEGEVLLPPELNDPPFTLEQLRAIYTPETVVPLFCCTPEPRRIEQVRYLTRGYKVDALFDQWLAVIPHHLPAYIAHRTAALSALLGWGRAEVCYPFETRVEPNALGVEFNPSPFNRWLFELFFLPLQHSWWFRPWLYWAINTLLLMGVLCFKPMRYPPAVVLLASGSLYMLPYAVAATACDLRLSWWMIVATVTAGGVYLARAFTHSVDDSNTQTHIA